MAGLTEAGVPNIAGRELATRDRRERDELFANVIGIRLSVAILGVFVATGFAIVAGYDRTLVIGTLVAGVGLVIGTVRRASSIPLAVSLRFGWLGTVDLVRQAAFVAVVIVLLLVDTRPTLVIRGDDSGQPACARHGERR